MEEKKLYPCPFCSATPEVWSDNRRTWALVEHREGCLWPSKPKHEISECDFEAWNTRAAVTGEQFAYAVHDGHLWARMDESEQEREIARLESIIKTMYCDMATERGLRNADPSAWAEWLREMGIEVEA